MTFTQDKNIGSGGGEDLASRISSEGREEKVSIPGTDEIYRRSGLEGRDMHIIVKYFEAETATWAEEDYAAVSHYRDVYSTENFSRRVREQMAYYPGMHSAGPGGTGPGPEEDPFKTNAQKMGDESLNFWNNAMDNPESFMAGLKTRQSDVDYTELFKGDAEEVASNVASAVAECIPCFDRIFDAAQLLPDGNLLEIHLSNIKIRTDLLDNLTGLISDPGFNVNICELLDLFAHLCPQDLLAILALLTQYLAKLNLDFSFNLDLIIELLGPVLSPFLNMLTQWLDKWVQMILAPIICVIDHINMTIYVAQQFKLPMSEAQVNLDYHAGVASPNVVERLPGGFSQAQSDAKLQAGLGKGYDPMLGDFQTPDGYDPFVYGYTNNEAFNVPDAQKYNPEPPLPPEEEIELAKAQISEDFGKTPNPDNYYETLSVEERTKMWDQIKYDYWMKENVDVPPPLRDPDPRDGRKWTPEGIPLSEKKQWERSFNGDYDTTSHPPEDQRRPKSGEEYYIDGGPLVDPIIQMRNIVTGGIRYIQDWFEWATQLIYDLLGTEFGWMKKKMDNTMLRSRIIQLITMIKAILEAVSKNGLQCGVNTNFDSAQLRFILEDVMSKISPYKFKANTDGTFQMILPSTASGSAGQVTAAAGVDQQSDLAQQATVQDSSVPDTSTPAPSNPASGSNTEQKTAESGIIIKDCLKRVRSSDVNKVREWISDFERRSDG